MAIFQKLKAIYLLNYLVLLVLDFFFYNYNQFISISIF